VTYQIIIQPEALRLLAAISDRRVQEQIKDRIEALKHDPEKQGKPLLGELLGCRSLRAAGQRYRIIYRVERTKVVVFIVAVGIRKEGSRKDIYSLARKLLRFRLL
jgi:mRNA interferase RelE/StbE